MRKPMIIWGGDGYMEERDNDIYRYQPLWGTWYIDMPIGKGSFGSVYKVVREEFGHKYTSAVKIISIPSEEQYREAEASFGHDEATLTGYFEDVVKNIVNEVNMLYSLSGNSNIVSYQDHKVVKKENCIGWDVLIRMEYVTSLRKYLADREMSREEIIRLGIDICTALELCSKKGIIHRDIKDENIFINEDGVFKVGDFGIAKELSKSGRAASMRGTPLYMAPEVFRGDRYDAAVDIYSVGIVLYKLLNNGRMPFMPPYPEAIHFKDSEGALEKRMTGQDLPMPARAGKALGKIVLKACAYKAEDRYGKASEMKRELEKVLADMTDEERDETVTIAVTKKETTEAYKAQEYGETLESGNETLSIFEKQQENEDIDKKPGTQQEYENPESLESTISGCRKDSDDESTVEEGNQESDNLVEEQENNTNINDLKNEVKAISFIFLLVVLLAIAAGLIGNWVTNHDTADIGTEVEEEYNIFSSLIKDNEIYYFNQYTEYTMENGISFFVNDICSSYPDEDTLLIEVYIDLKSSLTMLDLDFVILPYNDEGYKLTDAIVASYVVNEAGDRIGYPVILNNEQYESYVLTYNMPAEITTFTFYGTNSINNTETVGPVYAIDVAVK